MSPNFNISSQFTIEENYSKGLLPQRNQKGAFYFDSSCRSVLDNLQLSSENKRILRKTEMYKVEVLPLSEFVYDIAVQKQIYKWIKELGWEFPISSVKKIFTDHIFNYVYIWSSSSTNLPVAYSICYFGNEMSHIAYVFYDPALSRGDLPIRLSLEVIIDSSKKGLKHCYLGRFNPQDKTGYYKRNFPGFEYYQGETWIKYK